MNDMNTSYGRGTVSAPTLDMSVDAGLRSFMLGVYNKMALGLVLSAVIAYVVGTYAPVTQLVFGTPLLFVVQWGPLALLLGSSFLMRNPSPASSAALYWAIVTLMGAGLGFWVYLATNQIGVTSAGGRSLAPTFELIALSFMITASAFGALSLFGYTTKRDLSGFGSFLIMALWGVIALSLVNFFFLKSGMIEIAIMSAGLLLFAGLIAWQTQGLKNSYYMMGGDQRSMAIMTNMGALNLYIAFVQIFQLILSFLSARD